MKINQTIYNSVDYDNKISFNPEYQLLMPYLTKDEYLKLEDSILKDGCREIIYIDEAYNCLDGHHRITICRINKLPYLIKEISFDSEEEKIEWIVENQLGRRNIDFEQRKYLIGVLYNKRKLTGGHNQYSNLDESGGAKDAPSKTAQIIAKEYNLSERTVYNYSDYSIGYDSIRNGLNEIEKGFGDVFIKNINDEITNQEIIAFSTFEKDKQTEILKEIYEEYRKDNPVSDNVRSSFLKEAKIIRIAELNSEEYRNQVKEKLKEITIDNIAENLKVVNTYYAYESDKIKIRIYID
ncbi:MAG: hypothetical protein NTY74_04140 [Ignavibacteriae bacterium]|nr:hypothetical protein [Ignavibacteriota bacterium]